MTLLTGIEPNIPKTNDVPTYTTMHEPIGCFLTFACVGKKILWQVLLLFVDCPNMYDLEIPILHEQGLSNFSTTMPF